ncbi:hypothetical protein VTH06DRAFT_2480 [Thermothelomyces fergusii]
MSPRGSRAQGGTANDSVRSWLEAAIASANAQLPTTSPSEEAAEVVSRQDEPETGGEMEEPSAATASPECEPEASSVPGMEPTTPAPFRRKLATVRRVASVTSVTTTTNETYQLLAIDGWKVLARERGDGAFKAGEYVLFLEPDAFLPARSRFEDLFSRVGDPISFEGEVGYRVGTWAIRAGNEEVVSQGHVFRLSDFPDIDAKAEDMHWRTVQMAEQGFADMVREIDFSAELGVRKWEGYPECGSEAGSVAEETEMHSASEAEDDSVPVRSRASGENKALPDDDAHDRIATDSDGFPAAHPKPPPFIIKADMERVQNCPNLFIKPKYKHFVFQESVKLDGATMTVYFIRHDAGIDLPRLPPLDRSNEHTFLKYAVHPNGRLGVCSRTRDLLPHLLPCEPAAPRGGRRGGAPAPAPSAHVHYWATAIAAGLHRILPSVGRNVAVQAELVGTTVRGNPYNYPRTPGGPEHELFVFSITDVSPCSWAAAAASSSARLHPRRVEDFCRRHGLPHVPVRGYHTLHAIARGHETLMARADLGRGEGLVYKNCADGRWFKVLSTRWIRIKGDERRALERAGRVIIDHSRRGKKNRKKRRGAADDADADADADALEDREDASPRPRCWLAPPEVVQEILDIRDNLDEWIKKDEVVRRWVEWMNRDRHGSHGVGASANVRGSSGDGGGGGQSGPEEDDAGTEETNTNDTATEAEDAGPADDREEDLDEKTAETSMNTDEGTASAAAAAAVAAEPEDENAQKDDTGGREATRFGVSGAKRDQLISWLGVEGFGL